MGTVCGKRKEADEIYVLEESAAGGSESAAGGPESTPSEGVVENTDVDSGADTIEDGDDMTLSSFLGVGKEGYTSAPEFCRALSSYPEEVLLHPCLWALLEKARVSPVHRSKAVLTAVKNRHKKCLLLLKGMSIDCRDALGQFGFESCHCMARFLRYAVVPLVARNKGLIAACVAGHKSCVKMFMKTGACVNFLDPDTDTTPLLQAVRNTRFHIVCELIAVGADVNKKCEYGSTPIVEATLTAVAKTLHDVVEGEDDDTKLKILRKLIEVGADVNLDTNGNNSTALILATRQENKKNKESDDSSRIFQVISELLKAGADVNVTDATGSTSLMHACRFQSLDVIKLLLASTGGNHSNHGSDNESENINHGNHGLDSETQHGNLNQSVDSEDHNGCLNHGFNSDDVSKNLKESFDSESQDRNLDSSVDSGDQERSLNHGFNSDDVSKKLNESFDSESHHRDLNSSVDSERILNHGFNSDYVSNNLNSSVDCERSLNHGFDRNPEAQCIINKSDDNGNTALLLASKYRNFEIIKFLLESGADVNAIDEAGRSPLLNACLYQNSATVKLLCEQGADVNAIDEEGNTPLHYAYKYKSYETIKLLLRMGANVNIYNKSKRRAINFNYHLTTRMTSFFLLFAAGEILAQTTVKPKNKSRIDVSTLKKSTPCHPYFHNPYLSLNSISLGHACRVTIRRHLLKINPHGNLLYRIGKLGMPHMSVKFLLYGETIE